MATVTAYDDDYFSWLCSFVYDPRFVQTGNTRLKLLRFLYHKPFVWIYPMDENRAIDGLTLRGHFSWDRGSTIEETTKRSGLSSSCSMLEMMIALAIKCEKSIMDNPNIGDRTGQWFWEMVVSLGLGEMTDQRFDESVCESVIDAFINHEYEPNGKGGLFTVDHPSKDMRALEIWYQMAFHLDEALREERVL